MSESDHREKPSSRRKELWIGVVEVRPLGECSEFLGDAIGAFVNVVTWARDEASYSENIEKLITHLGGLFVAGVERAEPVRLRRTRTGGFNDELEEIIERASENPDAIIYATFHRFMNDDA